MKRNESTVLPLTPTQQPDSNYPAPLLPVAQSEVAQSEVAKIEPVLSNRTATNSSMWMALGSSSSSVVDQHTAPEKSHRSASASVISDSATVDAVTQFNLGERYYKGEGIGLDKAKAVECYKKAADQGHAVAQFSLVDFPVK
jgi:TPR repeat protein